MDENSNNSIKEPSSFKLGLTSIGEYWACCKIQERFREHLVKIQFEKGSSITKRDRAKAAAANVATSRPFKIQPQEEPIATNSQTPKIIMP